MAPSMAEGVVIGDAPDLRRGSLWSCHRGLSKDREAEGFLEPIDVRNGEFDLYDGDGCLLSASVDGRRTVITSTGVPAREALAGHLQQFFEATHIQMPSQSDWQSFVESSATAIGRWQRPRTRRSGR